MAEYVCILWEKGLIFKGFRVVWVWVLWFGWVGFGMYKGCILVYNWGLCECLCSFCGVYARFMQCMQFVVYS